MVVGTGLLRIAKRVFAHAARALCALWALGLTVRVLSIHAAAYLLWLALPKDDAQRLWSAWIVLPVSGAASWLAHRASRRPDADPGVRRAWAWLACAFLCQFLGDVVWACVESCLHEDPSFSWANLPYLFFYVFAPVGLLAFPIALRGRLDRRIFALDVAAVVLGGGLVLWRFLLLPNLAAWDDPSHFLPLAYPLGDLVTLVGLARLMLRRVPRAPGRSTDLLAAGFLLNVAGNTLWAVLESVGGYETAGLSDALWAVSYFVLVAAAATAARAPIPPPGPCPAPAPEPRSGRVLLASSALAYALLVVTAVGTASISVLSLSFGVLLLTGLVVARQLLAARASLAALRESTRQESAAVFRSLLRSSTEAVLVLERSGAIRYASPSAGPLFGVPSLLLVGRPFASTLLPEHASPLHQALRSLGDRPQEAPTVECTAPHPEGGIRHLECHLTDLSHDDAVRGVVVRARDVSELHAERADLFHRAFHDALTGLPGRELFLDRVLQALRARAREAEAVAVLFLDLDEFKEVNDARGHDAGDAVLAEVARRIRSCLRPGDTAGRLGGDEFAVVLDGCGSDQDTQAIAGRLSDVVSGPMEVGGETIRVGVSVGLARSRLAETPAVLLRRADSAMYRAKREGGGRVVVDGAAGPDPVPSAATAG